MRKEKIMWLRAGMLGTLVALLVLAVGGELSAQSKAAPRPFKIGIVNSMSGPGYGFAQRSVLGVRYKVEEEINKAGGINGHPVELIIYDTATKPDQAAMLVERAATVDKVYAIVGPNSSSDIAASFPTANRLGVVDFAIGGALRGMVEKNLPWSFSALVSNDFWAEPISVFADRFKVKTMVLMGDDKYNFAVDQAEWAYKVAARKGIKILHDKGKLNVETGWADFTPQVTRIKALAPDLIAAAMFPSDLAHLAVAIKQAGIDSIRIPLFGFGTIMPDFVTAGGEAAEYWYGTGDYDTESTDPVQQAWQKKMSDYSRRMSNDPGVYTFQYNHADGYVAAAFVCEAIKRVKITPDTPLEEARVKIRDELPKIKMKIYGSDEMWLGEGGRYEKNRLVAPLFLFQVKGGKIGTVPGIKIQ